jgi:hypothetical protein
MDQRRVLGLVLGLRTLPFLGDAASCAPPMSIDFVHPQSSAIAMMEGKQ